MHTNSERKSSWKENIGEKSYRWEDNWIGLIKKGPTVALVFKC